MEKKMSEQPLISLDMKKGRVRIFKKTFAQMGSPEYIEILINPKKKGFILRSSHEHKNAHRVLVKRLKEDRHSYELNSREFLKELQSLSKKLRAGNSYRLTGTLNKEGDAAFFSLEKAVKAGAGKEGSDDR